MELKPVELISLAALLHDIGKISQRAKIKIENNYNLEEYAPTIDNHPSYVHAAHTADFLDWFCEKFKINAKDAQMNLVNIASYHHKDKNEEFYKIIKYADQLASGFERTPQESSGDYVKEQLISIFSSVSLRNEKDDKNKKEYRFSLKPMSSDIEPQEASDNTPEDYLALFNGLKNDLEKLETINSFDVFYDGLNYLLEKYAWCVPSSSFGVKADISLYDHLRVSAAFAVALYNNYILDGIVYEPNDTQPCFALIQGDFSGIQNFIFSRQGESNKFAAKILRARSFFVSLSSELVANKICNALGLTKASIVMNAGGKFTILSQNTNDLEEKIDKITNEVNKEFLNLNFGQTRFAIANIALSPSDFLDGQNKQGKSKFSEKFESLIRHLERKKLKPFIENPVFEDYLDKIKNSKFGICRICGQHPANDEIDETPICKQCNTMKQIGESLVNKNYFGIFNNKEHGSVHIFSDFYLGFKQDKSELKDALWAFDIKFEGEFSGFAKSKIATYVPRFEHESNDLPRDSKDTKEPGRVDIKTFSDIAKDALKEDNIGSDFLGILKADVDNLGLIFARGLGENVSISKIASLSRMLDFFFTGWLQSEIRKNFKSVYTVFSGGDDLFLIGPFNQIINLAKKINEHLKQYTKNPDFHLSCGIYFAKDKIPVYQMARQAEEVLKESKDFKVEGDKSVKGKNAITLFERTMEWDKFNKLMEIDLDSIFKEAQVSDTFKYSLFTYLDMVENATKSNKARDLLWKALLIYNIYRNVAKQKKGEEKEAAIQNFLSSIVSYFEKYRGDFTVPLSKYIYENRKRRN